LLVGAGRGVRPELFLACAQVVLVLQVFQLRRQYPAVAQVCVVGIVPLLARLVAVVAR